MESTESTKSTDTAALQAELAVLRQRTAELEHERDATLARRAGRAGRSICAAVLIVLGVVCLTVMPVAVWSRNLLFDTGRYVETLTPIASDKGVQDSVIRIVDNQVAAHLDVKALVAEVLPPRAADVLGGALQGAVAGLVDKVTTDFVRSDTFEKLWVTINRLAHEQVRYLLLGEAPKNAAVQVDSHGKVLLDLSQVVQNVKDRLVAAGLGVASKVPTVGTVLEIANVQGLVKARKAADLLNTIADWLPWVGLAIAGGGVALARKRRRAVVASALGVGAGMVLLGAGLLVGRHIYLADIPVDVLPRPTAAFLFDTLVRFLRLGLRLLLLVALLVAFGAWVSGPGDAATRLRTAVTGAPRAVGRRLHTGPVGQFVAVHATVLRIGVVALAGIVLLMTNAPSLTTIVTLAVATVVLLLVVELLRSSAVRERTV